MRLESATAYALRIPFVEGFSHSTKSRTFSDAVVVKVRSTAGVDGFGEALPRPYVTGETVDTMLAHLKERLWPRVRGIDPGCAAENPSPEALLAFSEHVPAGEVERETTHNASRAALELALIDCWLRSAKLSTGAFLPPERGTVIYSGVITTGSVERTAKLARQMRLLGLTRLKIKVGAADDLERLRAVREVVGPEVSLRVDANGAWDPQQAVEKLRSMEPLGIAAAEQPIPRGDVRDLVKVSAESPIPIMVDESLISTADAESLISARACQYFNVRISKCGGLGPTIAIAKLALESGVGLQVGSQVGETAILSAAGRHVAAWLPDVAFVEGSFGKLLLSQDVSAEDISFGYGGEAPALKGVGFGVRVLEERLRRYATKVVEL